MGLRETLNKNQGLVVGLVVVLVLAAGWVLFNQFRGQGGDTQIPDAAFYTVDDGQTVFPESRLKVPPFEHEGKQAVRAYVYDCNGKQVVGYLEQYSPQAKPLVDTFRARGKDLNPQEAQAVVAAMRTGKQWKRPGEEQWGPANSTSGNPPAPKCDDGKPARLVNP